VVEIVFLMLVLKLPIVYLIAIVWWAVRAEPRPNEPAVVHAAVGDDPSAPRRFGPRRPRRGGPHERGGRSRRAARAARR
jgi:hypothetical protein